MRLFLVCTQCFREKGEPDHRYCPAALQDSGLYELVCRNGHKTTVCLQEMKFEVLFDLAANAIVDGYYREAIASFAASLERFFEFFVHVACLKQGVEEDVFEKA